MEIDTTTCWYIPKVYDEMINSIKKHLPLNEVQHGKVLINLLDKIQTEYSRVLDLGCGGALINTIIKGEYTGSDMEHIIKYVSKVCFSDLTYVISDVINDEDLSFISNYDIIIMNAFIDIMQYPLIILEKILSYANNYIIIHRQDITTDNTSVILNPSYGGWTYHSIININDLKIILDKTGFDLIENVDAGLNDIKWRSLILKKTLN